MPDMTPLEAAEIILNPRGHGTSERNAAECMAASYLRRIAAGEYKRVVRCQSCKHWDRNVDLETGEQLHGGHCNIYGGSRNDTDYCQYGPGNERKDGDNHE